MKRKDAKPPRRGNIFGGVLGPVIAASEVHSDRLPRFFARYEQLGGSIYLWLSLHMAASVSAEAQWWPVNGAFADKDLAASLEVSAGTARRWRKRLEALGVIRTYRVGRRLRRFELLNQLGQPAIVEARHDQSAATIVN